MSTRNTPRAMKRFSTLLTALIVLGALASVFLYVRARAASTYTWNQTGTASWATAGNWTPTRTTPAADDILVFNNGATTTVTSIPTQTIGQLSVSSNTTVNLQAAAAGTTLTIAGGTGTDLSVASGSQLNVNVATNTLKILVGAGATGSVSGSMTCTNAAHTLDASDASGITFNSGATFTQGTGCTGNAFTSAGTANAVVFASGSTFIQQAGSNPFGLGQPNSKVVFQTGSLFSMRQNSAPAFSGRAYANFEVNLAAFSQSGTGANTLSIDNLTVTAGTLNLGMTGTFNLKGNVSVVSGATLNFNPASAATLTLNGSAAQSISNAGTLTFQPNQNITVANTNGVVLNNAVTFQGTTTINAGAILAAAATVTSSGPLAVNGALQINQGGFYTGAGAYTYNASTGALVFNNTAGFFGVNNDAYWPTSNGPQNVNVKGAGGIQMNVARTVGGLFQYAAGVFGAGNLTLNGTSQINTGGFVSGSPTYGASSLLKYNTGGTYGRNGEWLPGVTSGAGYPASVQLSNNMTLDLPNSSTGSPFQLAGDLTIDSGSTMQLAGSTPLTQPLVVLGSVVNNGALTLSTAAGGDIQVGGNWTRASAATFTPNARAVIFNGGGNQLVTVTGNGTETFNYLIVNKSAGSLLPNNIAGSLTDVIVNATIGDALQILGAGGVSLSARTFTMSGDGGNLLTSGGARAINGPGNFSFTGAKTVNSGVGGTLVLGGNVTVNLFAGVNFGAGLTSLQGTLSIKPGGFVNTNAPTYDASSGLEYDTGGGYDAAAEFPANGVQNVSLASTTQLNLNGDKTIGGALTIGARTIGSTAATPFSLSAGAINIGAGALNLNHITTSGFLTINGSASINIAGNWNVNGFDSNAGPGSAVNFNGSGAQTILTGSNFRNLTLNNDLTVGTGASPGVVSTLALGSHKITTNGTGVFVVGPAANVTRTTGYVIGQLQKVFGGPGPENFIFDVGTANGYTPVEADNTVNNSSIAGLNVSATQAKLPAVAGSNALQRYWTLSDIGPGITTNLTFHYLAGDVVGAESNYQVIKYTGANAGTPPGQTVNTVAHTATVNGVSSFSDWTLAEAPSVFGALQFSASNYNDAEGNAGTHTATINVSRAGGGASGAVSVHYATSDGTATAGSDYVATSGDLNWADGDSADKTFNVTVNGDAANEPNETVNLTLTAPTGGATLGTPSAATLTITNDDTAPAAIVYVDDDWTGLPNGADPDGAGPATSIGYDAFSTIQGGVDGVATGGAVNVAAGTYSEQPVVGKSLTLHGAGANSTNITAPATLAHRFNNFFILFEFNNGANVEASGITVKGPLNTNGCASGVLSRFYGVYVRGGAALNLHDSSVLDIRENNPQPNTRCRVGTAVDAGTTVAALNQTGGLTLDHVLINGFQARAVTVDNAGSTATVTNNTLTGSTSPSLSQTVMLISFGASANISGNQISGAQCSDAVNCGPDTFNQAAAVGISLTAAANGTQITNNTISNNDYGINYFAAPNDTAVISGNTLNANRYFGVNISEGNATITGNTFSGASNVAVIAASVNDPANQTASNSTGTLTGNTITGATTALQLLDDPSFPADTFVPVLTAHFNRIVAATTAIDNPQNQTSNMENNWWGCNAGPGNTGCGAVNGTGVDFNPWFVLNASATPDTIIPGGSSTVAVDMTHNSDGAAPASTLPNMPVSYSATNGVMSPTSASVQNSVSGSTFTSTNASNATANVTVDNQTVSLPITVNAPSFSIDDVTHAEGNSGVTSYTFTVTKTGGAALDASVDYATADDTATAPSDYTSVTPTTLTFGPAETTKQFTINVNGDTAYEGNEQFFVNLSNPSGATIADGQGVGAITNDDAPPSTLVVNTTDDNDDGLCDTAHCSLREAIDAANFAGDANTINFQIPATDNGCDPSGVCVIAPSTSLPALSNGPVTIDGYTQPGASANTSSTVSNAVLKIVLSGANNSGGDGLTLSQSTVRGLVINNFLNGAILNSGNTFAGNFVGTDAAGAAAANTTGVHIVGNNNNVGGVAPADRNVVSGNGLGVFADGLSTINSGVLIEGNLVGANPAGDAAVGNGIGVEVCNGASNVIVGGSASAARNVISGNSLSNVLIDSTATTANKVQGNLIGPKADGSGPLAPGTSARPDARIAERLSPRLAAQLSRLIAARTGSPNDPPPPTDGVDVDGANGNIIGGVAAGEANVITGNSGVGVSILSSGAGNSVRGNSIHDNSGLGIDLGNDGVTANDLQDDDGGPNDLQNFPVIGSALVAGSTRTITGTLNSTPGEAFTIDFYSNASCDSSGNGEGQTYIGSLVTDPTDSNGDVSFTFHPASLSNGQVVTATATDDGGNTSEFSQCATVAGGAAGQIQFASTNYAVAENAAGQVAVIDLTRVGGSDGSISATFTTADGSAGAGSDYTAVNQTVTFNDGETSKTVNVPITDDSVYEGDETVSLALSSTTTNTPGARIAHGVRNAPGAPTSVGGLAATLTINENDAPPAFSVGDAQQSEGNSGASTFTFTVTKTGATALAASVDYSTSDGTATTANADYVAVPATTLNFAAGDTTKQFSVTVNGDTTPELDETFFVNLSNPSNATIGDGNGAGLIRNDDESVSAGQLIISEFRLRGPGNGSVVTSPAPGGPAAGNAPAGDDISAPQPSVSYVPAPRAANAPPDTSPEANDEFIELYNNTDSPLLVTTTDGSAGWAVAASDGVVRFSVPNGAIIPARGHFLGVNTLGYSLGSYPAGNNGASATNAAGDPVLRGDGAPANGYTLDIPDDAGIAVFRTANPANLSTTTRLDAAGSTAEAATLYKEGAGYPALAPADIALNLEHSFYRSLCSFVAGTGCTTPGVPKDSGDNAADFLFVDIAGTATAAGQRLGAPSPENLSGVVQRNSSFGFNPLDRSVSTSVSPNRVRDFNSDPANNSQFGTLSIRRRVTNSTASPVTRLRFRVVEVTTFPRPNAGTADLRARSSVSVSVSNVGDVDTCLSATGSSTTPCTVTVKGTTLEEPATQPNGGGFNSSISAGAITLATPLQPGESLSVQFLLGIQQTGSFRFLINIEALP
jgi:CSLREA domain-containing protein